MFAFLKKLFHSNTRSESLFQREEFHIARQRIKPKWLTKVLLAILLVEAFLLVQIFYIVPKTGFFASVLPGVLVELVNASRQNNNLPSLRANPLLEEAARLKVQDMAQRGYFSHNTPDGKTPWYWLDLVGYSFGAAGENLAVNFYDSQDINNAWMLSPAHRANILNYGFTEIGIATAKGTYQGQETIFVVQYFGLPAKALARADKSAPISASVQPTGSTPASSKVPSPASSEKQASAQTTEAARPGVTSEQTENAKAPSVVSSGQEEMSLELGNEGEKSEMAVIASIPEIVSLRESLSLSSDSPKRLLTMLSSWEKTLVAPRMVANLIYFAIGALIFLILLLRMVIRLQAERAGIVANGILVLVVIISLIYLNYHLFLAQAKVF